jgi:hypothetical protein
MATDDKNSRSDPTSAQAQSGADQPKNPYGGGPSTGLQFPPYSIHEEWGTARTAHADHSHWCGRQHRRESPGKDIRLLYCGRNRRHVITELKKSTLFEEKRPMKK